MNEAALPIDRIATVDKNRHPGVVPTTMPGTTMPTSFASTSVTRGPARRDGARDAARHGQYAQLAHAHGWLSHTSDEVKANALPATVTWLPAAFNASEQTLRATPLLLDHELFLADPLRKGVRYPRQKNVQGLYYFATVGRHIWHESLLEAAVLRRFDMRGDVLAVAAQPFRIDFADGTSHVPDFLLLLADHSQMVVDVKATKFLPKSMGQFERTHAVCDAVGWEYAVHWEAGPVYDTNIEYLNYFKATANHPGQAREAQVRDFTIQPRTLLDAALNLQFKMLTDARSALLHLAWTGALTLDLSLPINDRTTIRRSAR